MKPKIKKKKNSFESKTNIKNENKKLKTSKSRIKIKHDVFF